MNKPLQKLTGPTEDEDFSDFMDRCTYELGDVEECLMIWQEEKGAEAVVHKTHAAPVEGMQFVMSDETPDRMDDIIMADGWDLANFKRNPIALFGHRGDFPIGKWTDIRVENKQLKGKLELAPAGTSDRIDEIRKLIEAGILKAVSVGFHPKAAKPRSEKGEVPGLFFTKQELVETSLVSVPANPNALAIAKGLQISPATIDAVFAKPGKRDPIKRRGFTGKHAVISRGKGVTIMSLAQRIQDAETRLTDKKDALAALLERVDDNDVSDDQHDQIVAANAAIAQEERGLTVLQDSERHLAGTIVSKSNGEPATAPTRRPFAQAQPAAEKVRDGEYFMRSLVATVVARARGWRPGLDSPEPFFRALSERYGSDGKVDDKTKAVAEIVLRGDNEYPLEVINRAFTGGIQRAATVPATTGTAAWAGVLVTTGYQDFLQLLLPASVFPGLASRSMRMTFGRNGIISIPTRTATPNIGGAFVAEGAAIPVKQGAYSAQTFLPKKMGVISAFTREIAEHTTPAIEQLIRMAMQEDTSVSLDAVLLDATAATAIRPAGIRAGVGATTATAGGGFAALIGDIKALTAALMTGSNGNLRSPVWLMNPSQALSIQLTQNAGGDFPFAAEVNQARFTGYPMIVSGNVPAGMVILLDAADFVVIEGGAPRFDVSDQAVLHFEDTTPLQISSGAQGSGVLATPTRSLWQTDSMAIRMIMDVNWGFVRTGTIAWTQAVTW